MMDCITILAQAVEARSEAPEAPEEAFAPIKFIWEQIIALNLVEALTFICFGVVCVLYGWRIFKILVILCFGLAGLFAGIMVNEKLVGGNGIWLGIIGAALMAILSVPLMRWGISALGAVAGAILTGGIWYAVGLPEQYILAGALVGVIAGGMISFIIFKAAVMLFTSFIGGALVAIAILAVLYRHMGIAEQVEQLVFNHNWFLPVVLLAPTAVGVILQNKLVKSSKNWSV